MYCKQCGKEIPDGSNFCIHCGAAQAAPQPPVGETVIGPAGPAEETAAGPGAGETPFSAAEPTGAPAPELVIEPGPAPEAPPAPELTFDVPTPVQESAPKAEQPAPEPMPLPDPVPGPGPAPGPGPVNGPAGGPPPVPPTPAQPGGAPASSGANYDTLLKVFAVVCAVITGLNTLRHIPYVFNNLQAVVFHQVYVALLYIPVNLIGLAGYLVMTLALLLLAFRRTKENTEALTFGLAGGAALTLVSQILGILVMLIQKALSPYMYISVVSIILELVGLVFWLAVCLGGVWGILYLMKEAPALEHLMDDPAAKFAVLMDALQKGAGDVQQQASAAAASAKNAYDAHQAQQQAQAAQFQAAQAAAGYPAVRIPTDRSLIAYILLSIITCGIYSYYFIYAIARDVNIMCKEDGENTGGLLAFILLNFVTCGFYGLYWEYKLGNRLAANAPRYGINFQENGTTVLLWYLVGTLLCGIGPWVAMHILIKNTNALAAAYNANNGL